MENNAYWEQAQAKFWAGLEEEKLIEKISQCDRIVKDLHKSPVWKILVEDAETKRKFLDDNWQDITDEKILNNMRVKKSAVKYILELKGVYEGELERAKVELKKRSNTENEIIKDYDL